MSDGKESNIVVAVRSRSVDDADEKVSDIVTLQSTKVYVDGEDKREYDVDRAYDRSASNETLYADLIAPMVTQVYNGYNAVVVAYGSSSSGKAHTLFGDQNDPEGIIDRACDALFERINSEKATREFFVTVSMLQDRKGSLVDLLNPHPKTSLVMKDHRSLGAYVEDLCELQVNDAAEVRDFVKQGVNVKKNLMARNNLGMPHVVIDLNIESREKKKPHVVRQSYLRFVQCAGSGGVSLKVNQGLQALNTCVQLLATGETHIPFGQSELTRLLQPSLGGNAQCCFVFFLDPRQQAAQDTILTMELCTKVRSIRNKPRVNLSNLLPTIQKVRDEILQIRGQVTTNNPLQAFHEIDPRLLSQWKQLNSELERLSSRTWDARRRKSQEVMQTRRKNLKNEGLALVLASEVNMPDTLLASAAEHRQNFISLVEIFADEEAEVDQLRSRLRELVALKRQKWLQLHKGDPNAVEPKKDEKTLSMEKELEEKTAKLNETEAALKKADAQLLQDTTEIVTIEAEQNKQRMVGATNPIRGLLKDRQWIEMKKKIRTDPQLLADLDAVQKEYEQTVERINSDFRDVEGADAERLKSEVLAMAERFRLQGEALKRAEWEKRQYWGRCIDDDFRHRAQLKRYQDHTFFMFKNYRSHFETQKNRMEARYRELLENALRDALKLAEENTQLRMAN